MTALAPLRGKPGPGWPEKALLALAAGYVPVDLARAAFLTHYTFSGPESALWREWEVAFAEMSSHRDPSIREIGERGRASARQLIDDAERRERHEAVFGLD